MALERQRRLALRKALAVVGDEDARKTAAVGLDFYARRAGGYSAGVRCVEPKKMVIYVISGPKGAAAVLGLKRSTLQARMEKLGIRRARAAEPQRRAG